VKHSAAQVVDVFGLSDLGFSRGAGSEEQRSRHREREGGGFHSRRFITLTASSQPLWAHIGEGHGDTVVGPCARGHWRINSSSSSSSSAIGGCGQRVAIVGVGVGVGVVVARRRSSLSSF